MTENAKPIFREIMTTETAYFVGLKLLLKGFYCKICDVADYPNLFKKGEFDVVALLNVLDRSDKPLSLLNNSIHFLKDDGVIVITTPVPIRPAVWGTVAYKPHEVLVRHQDGSFEECVTDFYEEVLKPFKLVPISLSRLPYLCRNNHFDPADHFDNFLIVCKKQKGL